MIGPAELLPYGCRLETNDTWTVFDTHSGRAAELGFYRATNLSELDARELTAIFNRNTVGTPTRMPRYAIQGLPLKS
ncbi:hypothetical protein IB238_04030 [Rhizobium sp. ARZ01]|uniref:hypothetical protein n=1 Tax=Rhizobium sp. ARZ01 TaxID=2769313 RepID=UPI0017871E19|nr:hypothetical protein [Rhizobium sp. ARZ01]MBD9371809.1 hypothetical protein [Rhizobium sp. ARZ01]